MKRKSAEILRLAVLITALAFFGTGVLIFTDQIGGLGVRWLFDLLSAFLFLLIFFWLLAQEESLKEGS